LKSRQFVPQPGLDPALRPGTRHGLMQLRGAPTGADRIVLSRLGVELLDYIPDRAYVASLPDDLRTVVRIPIVRSVGPLQPTDKIDARILTDGVNSFARRGERVALTVVFFKDVPVAQTETLVRALGAPIIEHLGAYHMLRIELPQRSLPALLASDAVQWVEDVFDGQALNDGARSNLNVDALQAAPYGLDGTGVRIGEWDEGLAGLNQDLAGRIISGDGATVSSHSTHVAGTAIGSGLLSAANGGSPLQWRGMAPNAQIVGYNWTSYLSEYAGAISTNGIDLATNSWKSPMPNGLYSADSSSIDKVVTGLWGKRLPIIWAAGNQREPMANGPDSCDIDLDNNHASPTFDGFDCIAAEASAKNVITIGATNSDDNTMTKFSSWGPTNDGRLKPEIMGPGCEVGGVDRIWSTVPNDAYGRSCGTSMAAPAVAGSAALMLQRYRQLCPSSGDWLPSTLKALFVHTAVDLDDSTAWFNRGPDFASGYGRLDVRSAVDMIPFHLQDSVSLTGQVKSYPIVVASQKNLKITLAWDDPAAAANASVSLVDNLDLELVDPNGGSHLPWVLNPSSTTLTAPATRGVDDRNVVEQVVVDDVPPSLAGAWTIRVKATNLPLTAAQPFSLVSELLPTTSCTGPPPAADIWGADLAAPDAPVDTGVEPEPSGAGPMWISQDIRVRLGTVDDGVTHENPEFGQTNHVFVTVRNRGPQPGPYARVFLYWADASTGLAWPTDWHQIGSVTAANVPAGGNTVVGPIPWDPPGSGHFCLYARMVTFNEPLGPETADVNLTTLQHNQVIWKNVTVVDAMAQAPDQSDFVLRNPGTTTGLFNLVFQAPPNQVANPFLGPAEVVVDLGPALYERWARLGARLQGMVAAGGTKFRIVDARRAEFFGLLLQPREQFTVGMRISPGRLPPGSRYRFDVIETSAAGERTVGGVSYQVQSRLPRSAA
jgi:hypothetical protein